jgi:hypothetical protein
LTLKSSYNTIHQFKINKLQQLEEVLTGDAATVLANLNKDPGYLLVKELADSYNTLIAPKYDETNDNGIATYDRRQLELNTDSRIFPDANSTLRVTYGKVKGYEPKMPLYTNYLDGVMESTFLATTSLMFPKN